MAPATRLLAALALAASLALPLAAACPFAPRRDAVGRRGLKGTSDQVAPGATPELVNGAFTVPASISSPCDGLPMCDGTERSPSWIDLFAGVKQQLLPDEDLCYWSWQSLPPPGALQAQEGVPFDYATLGPEPVKGIESMGYLAWKRLNKEADPETCTYGCGAVVWGGLSFGGDMVRYMCSANISADPNICNDSHFQQWWRWPVASAVFRLNGTNTDHVEATVKEWRASPEGHQPMIESRAVTQEGWGEGGALAAKLFRCADIPAAFTNGTYPPPPLSAPGGPLTDVAMEFWQGYQGLIPSAAK